MQERWEDVRADFDDRMIQAGSVGMLESAHRKIEASFGQFLEIGAPAVSIRGGYTVVTCRWHSRRPISRVASHSTSTSRSPASSSFPRKQCRAVSDRPDQRRDSARSRGVPMLTPTTRSAVVNGLIVLFLYVRHQTNGGPRWQS